MRGLLALLLTLGISLAHGFLFELVKLNVTIDEADFVLNNKTYSVVYFVPKSLSTFFGFPKRGSAFVAACASSSVPVTLEASFKADVQMGKDVELFTVHLVGVPGRENCIASIKGTDMFISLLEKQRKENIIKGILSASAKLLTSGGLGAPPYSLAYTAVKTILGLLSKVRGIYVDLKASTNSGDSVQISRFVYYKVLDAEPRYLDIKILTKLPLTPGRQLRMVVENKSNDTVVLQIWGDYEDDADEMFYEAYLKPHEKRTIELRLKDTEIYVGLRDLYLKECTLKEYEEAGKCSAVVASIPVYDVIRILKFVSEYAQIEWFKDGVPATEAGPGEYVVCLKSPPLAPDLDLNMLVKLKVILDRRLMPDKTLDVEYVYLKSLHDFKVCINVTANKWSYVDELSARGLKLELEGYGFKRTLSELSR